MTGPATPGLVRVLLVEDDLDHRLLTRRTLERATRTRFSLRAVSTADEALAAVAADRPEVVLLEHLREQGTGMELLRELQRRAPLLPVILLTALDSPEIDEEAMRAGASDYLVKGELTPALLERAIRHALERARSERSKREMDLRCRMLVESAGTIVWNGDPTTLRFTYVSPEAEAVLGYPAREWLEDPDFWVSHIHPDDRGWAVPHCLEHTRRGEPHDFQYRMIAADGRVVWLRDIVRVRMEDGRPVESVGVMIDVTELVGAQEALRESEARLRQIAETIDQVFYLSSPDLSRVEYVSPAYRQVWGRDPDRVRHDPLAFAGSILPEDERVLEQLVAKRLRGEPAHAEYRIRRADGEIRWISDRSSPIRSQDGGAHLYAGLAEDVTARKEADARLAAAETHYRRLVVTSPMAIFALDAVGRFTELNPAGEELLKRKAARVLGRHFGEVVAVKDLERAIVAFTEIVSGAQERIEMELHIVRPSGERRLLHISVSGIGTEGRVEGLHGIARDVTDEREKERQNRLLAAALEGLRTEGVVIVNPKGRVVYANAAHARLLGYDLADRERLGLGDFLPDEQARREAGAIRETVERAGSWRGTVRRRRVSDGEVVLLDALIGRVVDGDRVLYVGILQDARQRLEHDRQMRRAERLASLGTLVSGVAHELNNPLHAITNFAELMLMDERGAGDQESLEIIQREANRAARVVGDLRQLSQQTQEEEAQRDRVDLNGVVRHVAKLRRYALATHNIELVEELEQGLPTLWADQPQLEQVLLNLIVNAEQALQGREGTRRLVVRTRANAGGVALHVGDTGPGIEPEHLERIFDPFWTTKPPGQGTGLGLSLVHSIVRDHGGEIRVQSELGMGTEFIVALPSACPAVGAEGVDLSAPPARPLRVLVVDDEAANRRLLVRHMERRGHAVAEAAEGGEALERLSERSYDVIVADVRMPGVGGDALLAELRARGTGLDRRVVFVTGDAISGDTSRIVATSGVPVLFKPIDLVELTRVIEAHADSVGVPAPQPGGP